MRSQMAERPTSVFCTEPPSGRAIQAFGRGDLRARCFHAVVRHHSMLGLETRPNVACDWADIVAQFFRAKLLEEGR